MTQPHLVTCSSHDECTTMHQIPATLLAYLGLPTPNFILFLLILPSDIFLIASQRLCVHPPSVQAWGPTLCRPITYSCPSPLSLHVDSCPSHSCIPDLSPIAYTPPWPCVPFSISTALILMHSLSSIIMNHFTLLHTLHEPSGLDLAHPICPLTLEHTMFVWFLPNLTKVSKSDHLCQT